MQDYECRKIGITACEITGLFLGIIAGVALGILFFNGLIPVTIIFIRIALAGADRAELKPKSICLYNESTRQTNC